MTGWGGDDGADGFSTGVARRPERERLEMKQRDARIVVYYGVYDHTLLV